MRFQKILCAVDFSDPAKLALQAAADLAKQFDASLTIFHVFQIPVYPLPEGVLAPTQQEVQALFEQIDEALAGWRKEALERGAPRVEILSRDGVAWREICARAGEEKSDLIVVGTHGRTGIRHALLGSVAERVVRHAPCPVLAVRPPFEPR